MSTRSKETAPIHESERERKNSEEIREEIRNELLALDNEVDPAQRLALKVTEQIKAYGERYWYAGDLILNYERSLTPALEGKSMEEQDRIVKDAEKNITRFGEIVERLKEDKTLEKKLGIQSGSDPNHWVEQALGNAISNPEQIALIALIGLLRISDGKHSDNLRTIPVERVYAKQYFVKANLPLLIQKFEELCQ